MPELKLLKDLLDRIAAGNERVTRDVEAFKELLDKVASTSTHVHIEVDYDGKEFTWTIPQRNMTAREWTPRDVRIRRSGG